MQHGSVENWNRVERSPTEFNTREHRKDSTSRREIGPFHPPKTAPINAFLSSSFSITVCATRLATD